MLEAVLDLFQVAEVVLVLLVAGGGHLQGIFDDLVVLADDVPDISFLQRVLLRVYQNLTLLLPIPGLGFITQYF